MTSAQPPVAGRARDGAGRPRNDRARDALGRPLPPGETGVPPVPDDLELDAQETVALARELWEQGRPFAAHEVFEAAWKASEDSDEEHLWRGLAQLMVAATHAMRGNAKGAAALFARSDETLAAAAAGTAGVDVGWWQCATAELRPLSDP